jgi:hypothetical protein
MKMLEEVVGDELAQIVSEKKQIHFKKELEGHEEKYTRPKKY